MNLENRTTYLTAEGAHVHIAGSVQGEHAARFVYSIEGDWYERSTGSYARWDRYVGGYVPHAPGSWRNITSKAADQSFWLGVEL